MLAYYRGHYAGAERLARVTSWVEVQKGFITVRLKNGDLFQDYGDRMTCPPGEVQPSTAREIVLSAKAKGWSAIEVTGSQNFKDSIALHAALNNIPCDHTLSPAGRQRLQRVEAEMRRSEVGHFVTLPEVGM